MAPFPHGFGGLPTSARLSTAVSAGIPFSPSAEIFRGSAVLSTISTLSFVSTDMIGGNVTERSMYRSEYDVKVARHLLHGSRTFYILKRRRRGNKHEKKQAGSDPMERHKKKYQSYPSRKWPVLSPIPSKSCRLGTQVINSSSKWVHNFIRCTRGSAETPPCQKYHQRGKALIRSLTREFENPFSIQRRRERSMRNL